MQIEGFDIVWIQIGDSDPYLAIRINGIVYRTDREETIAEIFDKMRRVMEKASQ